MNSLFSVLTLFMMMSSWWLFWLVMSVIAPTGLNPPSSLTILQNLLLLFSLLIGFLLYFFLYHKNIKNREHLISKVYLRENKSSIISNFILVNMLCLLMFSLFKSGFFSMSFLEYHVKVRSFEFGESLTGYKFVDLLTKLIIYPAIVYYYLVAFSGRKLTNSILLFSCLLLYVILWQVNYPLILMFWFLFFSGVVLSSKSLFEKVKTFSLVVLVFLLLVVAATIRYGTGSFSSGVIEHYVINYHLIGFSFYDYHFSNDGSILFNHSFGRSSLGFLEQFLELFLRLFGFDFSSSSFENRDFNMTPVLIGNGFEGNAFGTLLFTFYRDFSYVGILLGGILYGFFVCKVYLRSSNSWRSKAVCLLLLHGWFTGMMVSPIEQGYFWFCIVTLLFFSRLRFFRYG